MASFDKGAWRRVSDMIAQVRQGEMIIPISVPPLLSAE
jgi:cAMP phosphodiesterase